MQQVRATLAFSGMVLAAILASAGCGGSSEVALPEDQNLFVAGQAALDSGDTALAMQKFTEAIESKSSLFAHYNRARLYEQLGEDEKALADCDAALKILPTDKDALWLQGELNKPKEQRFKGRFANPPSKAK
jgi:tetratricopeptide (TPR) repeat protein